MQNLDNQCAIMVSQDSFYRVLNDEEKRNIGNFNFDDPNAFDEELLIDCLGRLVKGETVDIPIYDFATYVKSFYLFFIF